MRNTIAYAAHSLPSKQPTLIPWAAHLEQRQLEDGADHLQSPGTSRSCIELPLPQLWVRK